MEKKSKFRRFLTKAGSMRVKQVCNKFKGPFNFCWKTCAALIGVLLAISLVDDAVHTIMYASGRIHYRWNDKQLGENIEVRHFSNNTCATYDCISDKRISPRLRWISGVPDSDSLTVFCYKDGKRGFLNVNTGKVVIEGQYRLHGIFPRDLQPW